MSALPVNGNHRLRCRQLERETAVRILIADDHTLVRAGLRRLLEGLPGMEVVAEARSGRETMDLIALHRPDVVLLDLSMPDGSGLDVAEAMRRRYPEIAAVVCSMHSDAETVRRALDVGVRGFVLKDAAVAELELAVRAAAVGELFLSPRVSGALLAPRARPTGVGAGSAGAGVDALSPRQREILRRLGHGETTKQIAAALEISVKTVESHRARIMETLRLRRASELVRYATRYVDGRSGDDGKPPL